MNDTRLAKAHRVSSIDVTMQAGYTGFRYNPVHHYYQVLNSDGQAVDATAGPLRAQNVLVQNVIDEPDGTVDSIGSPSFLTHTVGTGTFTLYRDGRAISGKWSRKSVDDPTRFLDKSGKAVKFRPGQTWVMLAPQTAQITAG